MSNTPFLTTAATRTAHLRELSQHIRSLEWTNASLRDVETEIPDIETAIAVYGRLIPDLNTPDRRAKTFLILAEARVGHLRDVAQHLRALDRDHASLNEVDSEIPELEMAMTVYRRLTGETDEVAAATADSAWNTSAGGAPETPASDAWSAPNFSQFALAHLDPTDESNEGSDNGLEMASHKHDDTSATG